MAALKSAFKKAQSIGALKSASSPRRWAFFFRSGLVFLSLAQVWMLVVTWFKTAAWPYASQCFSCIGCVGVRSTMFQFDQRVFGFLIDGVGIVILLAIIWLIIRLSFVIEQGQLFTTTSTVIIKRMMRLFLAWVLYTPVKMTLLTLIETMHNPPGERMLTFTIAFGSSELVSLVIWCGLMLVAFAIHQGISLYEEHTLTI